jgi:hypothetical protein
MRAFSDGQRKGSLTKQSLHTLWIIEILMREHVRCARLNRQELIYERRRVL